MAQEEWVGTEKQIISHGQIYERLVQVERKIDELDDKTSQVVKAFNAATSAFLVLEWIGKLAKPILWFIALGAAIVAIYERYTK